MRRRAQLDPIHPGEILLQDFMKPRGISINQLGRDLDVTPNRISAIVNGTRSITADTALKLGAYFGISPETWLGLQLDYDLRVLLAAEIHEDWIEATRYINMDLLREQEKERARLGTAA